MLRWHGYELKMVYEREVLSHNCEIKSQLGEIVTIIRNKVRYNDTVMRNVKSQLQDVAIVNIKA